MESDWQELYIASLLKIKELREKIEVLEEILHSYLPIIDEED
jgi:hypothetical protein